MRQFIRFSYDYKTADISKLMNRRSIGFSRAPVFRRAGHDPYDGVFYIVYSKAIILSTSRHRYFTDLYLFAKLNDLLHGPFCSVRDGTNPIMRGEKLVYHAPQPWYFMFDTDWDSYESEGFSRLCEVNTYAVEKAVERTTGAKLTTADDFTYTGFDIDTERFMFDIREKPLKGEF